MPDFDGPDFRYRPWSLTAQAVQLSDDNTSEVAAWCGGTLTIYRTPDSELLELNVHCWDMSRIAQIGDWVVKEQDAFEVYDTEDFREHFRAMHLTVTDWPTEDEPRSAPKMETGL